MWPCVEEGHCSIMVSMVFFLGGGNNGFNVDKDPVYFGKNYCVFLEYYKCVLSPHMNGGSH